MANNPPHPVNSLILTIARLHLHYISATDEAILHAPWIEPALKVAEKPGM